MDWVGLVERLGFPIAIALILLGMMWKSGRWCAYQIIVPLRDAHIHFMAALQDTQHKQADSLQRLTALGEQHAVETAYIRQLLEAQANHHKNNRREET